MFRRYFARCFQLDVETVIIRRFVAPLILLASPAVSALSVAPEEIHASRQVACVLAQQSLGQLSEEEYGTRLHEALDGFDDSERDGVLGKAVGYYDGLMFSISDTDNEQVERRLQSFVASDMCRYGVQRATVSL